MMQWSKQTNSQKQRKKTTKNNDIPKHSVNAIHLSAVAVYFTVRYICTQDKYIVKYNKKKGE